MAIALSLLTYVFLAGLAGSAIVAVLFIFELLRVTLGPTAKDEQHAPVEG
jgi:hypothetical protein